MSRIDKLQKKRKEMSEAIQVRSFTNPEKYNNENNTDSTDGQNENISNVQTEERTNVQMNESNSESTDVQKYESTNEQTEETLNNRKNSKTNSQKNDKTEKQTKRRSTRRTQGILNNYKEFVTEEHKNMQKIRIAFDGSYDHDDYVLDIQKAFRRLGYGKVTKNEIYNLVVSDGLPRLLEILQDELSKEG